MIAKYPGTCATCGEPIAAGDVVTWNDRKLYHPQCGAAPRSGAERSAEPTAREDSARVTAAPQPAVDLTQTAEFLAAAAHDLRSSALSLAAAARVFTTAVERMGLERQVAPPGHWTHGVEPTEAGAELKDGDPL